MSYWIPFRKKEEKENNKSAMLSLETMFRLHEIAENLVEDGCTKERSQNSIGFYCGFEKQEELHSYLPFEPPEVIRMKKQETLDWSFAEKYSSITSSNLTVCPSDPCALPVGYILSAKRIEQSISVTGTILPLGVCASILAAIPGSSYGEYILPSAPKNKREYFFIPGK